MTANPSFHGNRTYAHGARRPSHGSDRQRVLLDGEVRRRTPADDLEMRGTEMKYVKAGKLPSEMTVPDLESDAGGKAQSVSSNRLLGHGFDAGGMSPIVDRRARRSP